MLVTFRDLSLGFGQNESEHFSLADIHVSW